MHLYLFTNMLVRVKLNSSFLKGNYYYLVKELFITITTIFFQSLLFSFPNTNPKVSTTLASENIFAKFNSSKSTYLYLFFGIKFSPKLYTQHSSHCAGGSGMRYSHMGMCFQRIACIIIQ